MSLFARGYIAGCVWILFAAGPIAAQPQQEKVSKPDGKPKDLYGDPLPAGALGRLGTVRFRHEGYGIQGLAFLPDGKALVAGEQNSLRLWETATGRRLGAIATDLASFQRFALSPDGKQIAVLGTLPEEGNRPWQYVVEMVDVGSSKKVRTFSLDNQKGYHALAFTPDSKFLALLDGAGVLRIEEIASGSEILRQQFPGDVGAYLAMSPDGETIAVGSGPNTRKLYLWKWQAGEEPRELTEQGERTNALCFSPDGKILAACDDYGGAIRLLDTRSGRLIRSLTELEDTAYFIGMAFSPDGKVLATTDGGNRGRNFSGRIILWDPTTGKHFRELSTPGDSQGSVTISSDSRWLAAGGGGGVHVWDLRTGKEVSNNDASHRGMIAGIAVTSDGLVATASDDQTVRVWDVKTYKQQLKLEHNHWVRAVALSPDGRLLASSSLDDTVMLWDVGTGREIYKLAGHGKMGGRRALAFLPDSKHFLSWGDDFYLRVWDTNTGKALVEHAIRPSGVKIADEDAETTERERFEMLGFGEFAFSPDGKILVLSVLNNFHVFDVGTGKEVQKIPNEGSHVASLAISPNSKLLLASAWGKQVVTKLTDGSTRYSAAKEYPVCLWELDTGKLVQKIMLPGTAVGPVAFSSDGKIFAHATSSPEGSIRFFEAATGREIRTIKDLPGSVNRLTFSPDNKFLVAGMQDTTALIWQVSQVASK